MKLCINFTRKQDKSVISTRRGNSEMGHSGITSCFSSLKIFLVVIQSAPNQEQTV